MITPPTISPSFPLYTLLQNQGSSHKPYSYPLFSKSLPPTTTIFLCLTSFFRQIYRHISLLLLLKKKVMTSIVQTIQQKSTKQSLPISSPSEEPSLRRRLSSLSLKLHPSSISSSPATSWAIHRSKSLSSMGENAGSSIKKWWDLSWAWILSRNPTFVQDLEMNEEEKHLLGFPNRGSLMHLFFKVKSEVRKLFRYDDMSLPQTHKYGNQSLNGGMRRGASTLG